MRVAGDSHGQEALRFAPVTGNTDRAGRQRAPGNAYVSRPVWGQPGGGGALNRRASSYSPAETAAAMAK